MLSKTSFDFEFGSQTLMDKTNWNVIETNFLYNIAMFSIIIIASFLFHWIMLIRTQVITIWSFERLEHVPLKTYRQFLKNLKDYYKIILSINEKRYLFIDVYGFQIFFFLCLELYMFIAITVFFFSLLFIWYFFILAKKSQLSITGFLLGRYDFQTNSEIITIFAYISGFIFWIYISIATKMISETYSICFCKYKNFESKLGIMPNVVYISKIPRFTTNIDFRIQMKERINLSPEDYSYIRFPNASKLYKYQIQIEKIKERLQNPDFLYWWFISNKEQKKSELLKKIELLTKQYEEELSTPINYTQAALLCLHSPAGLENFTKFVKRYHKQKKGYKNTKEFKRESIRYGFFENLLRENKLELTKLSYVFLFSYDNFNFPNIEVTNKMSFLKKFLLASIVIVMILFITTPLSLLELGSNLILNKDTVDFVENIIAKWKGSKIHYILTPLTLSLMNILFLFIIDRIGRISKFFRFSTYHQFILRFSFSYLMLNTFVIPIFLMNTEKSLFSLIRAFDFNFSLNSWVFNLKIYEESTIMSEVILQSGAVGFFLTLNLFSDGVLNFFRYKYVFNHFKKLRKKPYLKDEGDLYEFGYFYGYNTIVIYFVFVFGIYTPLIAFSGMVYFGLKSFANLVAQTHYLGQQFESGTVLPNMFINRAKYSIPMMLIILSIKCYLADKYLLFSLNLTAGIYLILIFLKAKIRTYDFTSLFSIGNYFNFGKIIKCMGLF